jgi:hypothetical protein
MIKNLIKKPNLKLITLVYFLVLSIGIFAQNSIYIGTTSYQATDSWRFTVNDYSLNKTYVTIAKKSTGGLIMLTIPTTTVGKIKGDIIIYLENGNAIKCIDRNIRDQLNNEIMAVYYLSQADIQKMSNSDILNIRFTLSHYPYEDKNYLMENSYTTLFEKYKTYKHPTAQEISNLF